MKTLSLFAALVATTAAVASPPRSGAARGSCSIKNEAAIVLTRAAVFVDSERDGKPTVLILSDVKLPVEKWTSEKDIDSSGKKFSGAVFVLTKGHDRAEASFYWKGKQYGATYYLKLQLEQEAGGEFVGSVTTESEGKSARAQRSKIPGTFGEAIEYLRFDADSHAALK